MLERWQSIKLWKRVFIGLGLGFFVGIFAHYMIGEAGSNFITQWIKPWGDAFVRLIKMLVMPLIFTTLISGVIAMGDPKRLGSLGLRTISLYLITTFFAVWLGLIMGSLFQPGTGIDLSGVDQALRESLAQQVTSKTPSLTERFLAIIPTNPAKAFVGGDVIAIIFFAIIFGIGILLAGDKGKPVANFFDSAAEIMMRVTMFVMEIAPFGVFALIAWVMADMGLGILINLGKLTLALYAACLIQILFVYGGLIIRTVLHLPMIRYFTGILDAQGVAYSTASSNATLPVSISCAEHNLGIDESISGSVLPLGATINMDGTAIYLGIIALFAAQALGLDLSFADYAMIALTATLTSIGTAGIPSASLFLAFTVLGVFGVTLEQYTLIIALILPFDRILDMMRTVTNVSGDLAVATAVAKWENQLDEDTFRRITVH